MGFLDAVLEVADDDGWVLAKVHHRALAGLQVTIPGVIELVRVVEERLGLAGELDEETVKASLGPMAGPSP